LNTSAATGSLYRINYVDVSIDAIKDSVWATFASYVLYSL